MVSSAIYDLSPAEVSSKVAMDHFEMGLSCLLGLSSTICIYKAIDYHVSARMASIYTEVPL